MYPAERSEDRCDAACRRRRAEDGRRGAALVAVLVLLSVFMLLAAGWARRIVGERQEVRRWHVEVQATRLAESGLARARAQLAASAEYRGEVWEIPADSWEAGQDASVRIDVDIQDRDSDRRLVEIVARARFPQGSERAVQRTRRALFRFP